MMAPKSIAIVPEGVAPGGVFHLRMPNGQMMAVTCPPGVTPGQRIRVSVDGHGPPRPGPPPGALTSTAALDATRPCVASGSNPDHFSPEDHAFADLAFLQDDEDGDSDAPFAGMRQVGGMELAAGAACASGNSNLSHGAPTPQLPSGAVVPLSQLELMPSARASAFPCSLSSCAASHIEHGNIAKRARREIGESAASTAQPGAQHFTAAGEGGESAAVGSDTAVPQSTARLLSLASSQAQLSTYLQDTLAVATEQSDDPNVAAYLACLQRAVEPITEASSVLQHAVDGATELGG